MKFRWLSVALPALLLVSAACNSSATPQNTGSSGGATTSSTATMPQRTLVIGVRGELPSLASKPLVPVTGALAPPATLFNATLDFSDERGIPQPYLTEALPSVAANTWRVFPDGKMETEYTLKPNLTWQDGTPLSAEDFVFAWKVYSSPELGVANSPPINQMEEATAPDPRTLIIRWRQTYGDAGAMQENFQALPRHILGDQFAQLDPSAFVNQTFWTQDYIGLGPYRITGWEPGAYVDASAFDNYVFGKPKIDKIRVQVFSDPNAAMAGLLAGQVSFIGDFVFSETDGDTLEQRWHDSQGGTVLFSPVELRMGIIQLRPDIADAALLDVRVRRALAESIDNPTAVEVLTLNKGLVTNTLSSPAVDYYADIEKGITNKHAYDPRMAAQHLEEAGFVKQANGFYADRSGKQLSIPVWSSSGAKNEREVAVYTDSMKRVGWDTSINIFSAAQLADAQARALTPGLAVRGLGQKRLDTMTTEQIPRPETRWQGDNRGGWVSPEYDAAFNAYVKALDRPERIRQIVNMERIFAEDVGAIPHFFSATVNAYVSSLQGPVKRQVPESGIGYLYINKWEWKS